MYQLLELILGVLYALESVTRSGSFKAPWFWTAILACSGPLTALNKTTKNREDRKQETGDWRQETGDRRQETVRPVIVTSEQWAVDSEHWTVDSEQ